jgi:CheY-like chemotaxis protein
VVMKMHAKILLVDDDHGALEIFGELLRNGLPSKPDVRPVSSGARALALLEAEVFNLMIVDLQMPKVDGLQVITVARRRFPSLKLVVLTGIRDEQFRSRTLAMGVDLHWIKPDTEQEVKLFLESIEALLVADKQIGFRGVQSKSLVDIIQLECLSQNSCVLNIHSDVLTGRIWIQTGEVVHAEVVDETAEPAFQRMLGWRSGWFEVLPADPAQPRTIFSPYQCLLLNTAQALDEVASQVVHPEDNASSVAEADSAATFLAELSQMSGVEFLVSVSGENRTKDFCGLQDPQPVSEWMRSTMEGLNSLGEELRAGELHQVIGSGPEHRVALIPHEDTHLCVGFAPSLPDDVLNDTMKTIHTKWAS